MLERYELPVYDARGKKRSAPLRAAKGADAPVVVDRLAWVPGAAFRGDIVYIRRLYAQARREFPDAPAGDHVGIIHAATDGRFEVYFSSVNGNHSTTFNFYPVRVRDLDAGGKFKESEARPIVPGIAYLRRLVGIGASREERIAVLAAVFGPQIRAKLQAASSKSELMSPQEYADTIAARVGAEIAARERTFPHNAVAIATLDIGGATHYLPLPGGAAFEWEGTAVLLPVAALVHRTDVPDSGTGVDGASPERKRGRASAVGGTGDEAIDPRGVIDTGIEIAPFSGAVYPGGERDAAVCDPFLGEPVLAELGSASDAVVAAMGRLADVLDMPPCRYAGAFGLNAAAMLAARADDVGGYAAWLGEGGFLEPVEANVQANLQSLAFRPTASPGIQYMRRLATVVPPLTDYALLVCRLYARYPNAIEGMFHGDAQGWSVQFLYEVGKYVARSVGVIFGQTCRILFLQLLQASRDTIAEHRRPENIGRYESVFAQIVVPQLQHVNALMTLRSRLDSQIYAELHPGGDEFGGVSIADAGPEFVPDKLGWTTAIKDADGKEWTVEQLDRAIALRRGAAEAIDPIVKQFTDLPDVMRKMGPDGRNAPHVLYETFNEMLENNAEQVGKARDSWLYAFRAGKIHEAMPGESPPGVEYVLQGIHLQAHQQIAEFFGNTAYYANGVNRLFSGEEAWAEFKGFIEFAGIVLLSVVCPPLGTAVGIAAAAYHLHEAHERESLYRALIDPDEIVSWGEVQAELFAARLGLALAFIPDAITVAKAGFTGARVAAKEGLLAGSRAAVALVRDEALAAMQQALRRGLIEAFVTECVKAELINALIERALTPILEEYEAEIERSGPVGGAQGALALVARLEGRAR